MKSKGLLAGALLLVAGTVHADIVGARVYCEMGLNASGKEVIKCTAVPEPGGTDGPRQWQEPEPGWNGSGGVGVVSATYGWSCGASFGNVTYDIGTACDGASRCDYSVDYRVLGDPAPGCAKTFTATYICNGDTRYRHSVYVAAEAGFGSIATFNCE